MNRAAAGLGADPGAAALWAALAHLDEEAAVRERIRQDLKRAQSQALALEAAERERLRALLAENQVLARALARAQQRHSAWHAQREAERQRMQQEIEGLRCALDQARRSSGPNTAAGGVAGP